MFADQLNSALADSGMTAKQLAERTHLTEAAISRYRSGDRTPRLEALKKMADALDVDVKEFLDSLVTVEAPIEGKIPSLSVMDVSKIMGLPQPVIRQGLRQGIFPWGYAIQGENGKWTYFVNQITFMQTEGIKL